MLIYPYSAPIILTEPIFTTYGGQTGSATSAQLQGAFLIAEQRTSKYIGTFLLPTIVTGTYPYNHNHFITTDYGYVNQILFAKVFSTQGSSTCTLKTDSGCAYIFEDTFGYLNYSCVQSVCNCSQWQYPYQFQIAYQAGLPTGTASQAPMLHALTIVAELALNEMIYPRANETAGDRGVESFSMMNYSERRKKLKSTALGQSARANYAAELISSCIRRAVPAITMR